MSDHLDVEAGVHTCKQLSRNNLPLWSLPTATLLTHIESEMHSMPLESLGVLNFRPPLLHL